MQILISGRASVYSDGLPSDPSAVTVTDPTILGALEGYDAAPDDLSGDLDRELRVGAGVTGGTLRFAYDRGRNQLRVVTEYRCPRPLTDAEVAHLVRQTEGMWTDGVGGDGFEAQWEGGEGRVYPYPPGYPGTDVPQDTRAEQLPD